MNEFVHVMYTCVLMYVQVYLLVSFPRMSVPLYAYLVSVPNCSPHCRPSPLVGKRNRATSCLQQARKTHDVHAVLCCGLTHSPSLFTVCTAC